MDYIKKTIWGPDPKEQVCIEGYHGDFRVQKRVLFCHFGLNIKYSYKRWIKKPMLVD